MLCRLEIFFSLDLLRIRRCRCKVEGRESSLNTLTADRQVRDNYDNDNVLVVTSIWFSLFCVALGRLGQSPKHLETYRKGTPDR